MTSLVRIACAAACVGALSAADASTPAPTPDHGAPAATATSPTGTPAAAATPPATTAAVGATAATAPAAATTVARPPPPAPFLGVTLDRPSNFDANDGLLVTAVVPQSTFDHLGVRAGDRILSANGAKLNEMGDFGEVADKLEVGQLITLMVRTDTAIRTVSGRIEAVSRPREISQHTTQLSNEIAQLREAVSHSEPSRLNDTLSVLKQLEADLPGMLDAFKKRYPNGRFNISVHIDILSDQGAANPTAVVIPSAPLPPGAAAAATVPGTGTSTPSGAAAAPAPAPAAAPASAPTVNTHP